MDPGIARHVGARLLGEVEEESLESLLTSFQYQTSLQPPPQAEPPPDATTTTTPISAPISLPLPIHPKLRPLPRGLRDLVARHQQATAPQQSTPQLSVTGRYLPLLYHVVSTVVAAPHRYAVLVVDPEARFDVTRLVSSSASPSPSTTATAAFDGVPNQTSYPATAADLRHVHVLRPPLPAPPTPRQTSEEGGESPDPNPNPNPQRRNQHQQQYLRDAVAAAREWMLYAPGHGSRDRELWGVVVVGGGGLGATAAAVVVDNENDSGGGGGGGDVVVTAGWRGWLRVEREEVPGFGATTAGVGAGAGGMSVEEALALRSRRNEVLGRKRWVAGSRWGVYAWGGA